VNRNFAGPSRNTTEVDDATDRQVETSVGTTMPAEPWSVTVESSTRMPIASARPPSGHRIDRLTEKIENTSDVRIERGNGDHDHEGGAQEQ
jgi:hypothetical protein